MGCYQPTERARKPPQTYKGKCREFACLWPLSPSNSYPHMWSVALAAAKTAETRRGLGQATLALWAYVFEDPPPKWKSGVTKGISSWGSSVKSQRLDKGKRGDTCHFSQERQLPLSSEKLKRLFLINTIDKHSAGVCGNTHKCEESTNSTCWFLCYNSISQETCCRVCRFNNSVCFGRDV